MHTPIKTNLPRLDRLTVEWQGRHFSLPHFYREGTGGPAVLFVHGLGGSKENFYAAFQSPALADCTLATFDQPGTGLAPFDPDAGLDVSALADMAQSVADQLLPGPYFLAGASMGGLITCCRCVATARSGSRGISTSKETCHRKTACSPGALSRTILIRSSRNSGG